MRKLLLLSLVLSTNTIAKNLESVFGIQTRTALSESTGELKKRIARHSFWKHEKINDLKFKVLRIDKKRNFLIYSQSYTIFTTNIKQCHDRMVDVNLVIQKYYGDSLTHEKYEIEQQNDFKLTKDEEKIYRNYKPKLTYTSHNDGEEEFRLAVSCVKLPKTSKNPEKRFMLAVNFYDNDYYILGQ